MKDSGEFIAHEMINPSNGDVQEVENHEKHMELKALGYVHHGHDMGTDDDHGATKLRTMTLITQVVICFLIQN